MFGIFDKAYLIYGGTLSAGCNPFKNRCQVIQNRYVCIRERAAGRKINASLNFKFLTKFSSVSLVVLSSSHAAAKCSVFYSFSSFRSYDAEYNMEYLLCLAAVL